MDTPVGLVDRNFVRLEPDQLWVIDIGRREAFSDRAVVKKHRLVPRRGGHVESQGQPEPRNEDEGGQQP